MAKMLMLLGMLMVQTVSVLAQSPKLSQENKFPGVSATPASAGFAGFTATPNASPLPGTAPSPLGSMPLAGKPSVIALPHREPADIDEADSRIISGLQTELAEDAARSNFDIRNPAWHYQQIVCAALPDYLILAFSRGAQNEGSSRFVAVLPRDGSQIDIVVPYAHGLLPFRASWGRPGSFAIFNRMLKKERGNSPLGDAPNWLAIGMCYAEITGYPVQVLSTSPYPEPTLDLLRLNANRPQLLVTPDQSAAVSFSDVSQPGVTVNWSVYFDRRGEVMGRPKPVSSERHHCAQAPTVGSESSAIRPA